MYNRALGGVCNITFPWQMKDDKSYHMSTCDPVSCEDVKLAKGFQSVPFSEVNTKKTLSRACRNEILKGPIATDNTNCELVRRTRCINKINQVGLLNSLIQLTVIFKRIFLFVSSELSYCRADSQA